MRAYPSLRRGLVAALTLAVLGAVLAVVLFTGNRGDADRARADEQKAARNWPLFGGTVQRNLVNSFERNIADTMDIEKGKEGNIKWVQELGSRSYGGPVVAGGKIFVGTNNQNPRDPKIQGDKGVVMCFNEADGKFLWQAIYDKQPIGRAVDWPLQGICSSPVVEGNRLWFVNNLAQIVCADVNGDAKTQKVKELWKVDMMKPPLGVVPHNLATCSPLIVGDTLFIITSNGVDLQHINIPAPQAPSFLALDKNSGKVLWKNNLPSVNLIGGKLPIKTLVNRGMLLMHGQWSNPVYTEIDGKGQIVFPGGDGWIYSFNPADGKLIWKFDCNPKDSIYTLGPKGTRNDFVSTPIIYKNRLYIGVGQDPEHDEGVGHLWCIDMTKKGDVSPTLAEWQGDKLTQKDNPNSAKVWHYGGALDKPVAGRKWEFGRTLSTCAIKDDILYVGELSGWFHCLDANTGKPYWTHNMKASTWSSPYIVDGKVYIGNDDNQLLVFQHGKVKKLLNTNELDGKVRATPVACNGVLYVMTENKLYAISPNGK